MQRTVAVSANRNSGRSHTPLHITPHRKRPVRRLRMSGLEPSADLVVGIGCEPPTGVGGELRVAGRRGPHVAVFVAGEVRQQPTSASRVAGGCGPYRLCRVERQIFHAACRAVRPTGDNTADLSLRIDR